MDHRITDAVSEIKVHRTEHSKYLILKELLEEDSSNLLDSELKAKIKTIISGNVCKPVLDFDGGTYSTSGVLGISDLLHTELTPEESTKVSRMLQIALDSKYSDLCCKFKTATGDSLQNQVAQIHKHLDDSSQSQDSHLFTMRSKIVDQRERYLRNLDAKHNLLHKLASCRLEKLPDVCADKVEEYDTITRLNALKSQLVREKTRTNIFTQADVGLGDYKEVINGLKAEVEKCNRSVEMLQELQKSYNQHTGKQYDEVLKLYTQYKTGLEKKQLMISTFHK